MKGRYWGTPWWPATSEQPTDQASWTCTTKRNQVEGKFKDGKQINDFCDLYLFEMQKKCIARIKVHPRSSLSFLKKEGGSVQLYRRQGTRTVSVAMDEFEDFLLFRKERGLAR